MSSGFSKAQVTLIILGDWSLFIISTLAEPITSFARGKFFSRTMMNMLHSSSDSNSLTIVRLKSTDLSNSLSFEPLLWLWLQKTNIQNK